MPFPGSVGRQLAWNGGARSRSPHRHSTSSCSAAGSSSWSFAAQVTDTGRKWLPLPKGKGYFVKDDTYQRTQGESSCDDGSYYDSKQGKGKGDSSYGSYYDGKWEKGEDDYDRAKKKDTAGQYDKKL